MCLDISRSKLEPHRTASDNLYCGGGAAGGVLDLDLDIRDGGACPGEVGCLGLGVLGVVVRDGGLDGILSQHGAVDYKKTKLVSCHHYSNKGDKERTLDGRQAQLLRHIGVLDLSGLLQGHAADEFGQITG